MEPVSPSRSLRESRFDRSNGSASSVFEAAKSRFPNPPGPPKPFKATIASGDSAAAKVRDVAANIFQFTKKTSYWQRLSALFVEHQWLWIPVLGQVIACTWALLQSEDQLASVEDLTLARSCNSKEALFASAEFVAELAHHLGKEGVAADIRSSIKQSKDLVAGKLSLEKLQAIIANGCHTFFLGYYDNRSPATFHPMICTVSEKGNAGGYRMEWLEVEKGNSKKCHVDFHSLKDAATFLGTVAQFTTDTPPKLNLKNAVIEWAMQRQMRQMRQMGISLSDELLPDSMPSYWQHLVEACHGEEIQVDKQTPLRKGGITSHWLKDLLPDEAAALKLGLQMGVAQGLARELQKSSIPVAKKSEMFEQLQKELTAVRNKVKKYEDNGNLQEFLSELRLQIKEVEEIGKKVSSSLQKELQGTLSGAVSVKGVVPKASVIPAFTEGDIAAKADALRTLCGELARAWGLHAVDVTQLQQYERGVQELLACHALQEASDALVHLFSKLNIQVGDREAIEYPKASEVGISIGNMAWQLMQAEIALHPKGRCSCRAQKAVFWMQKQLCALQKATATQARDKFEERKNAWIIDWLKKKACITSETRCPDGRGQLQSITTANIEYFLRLKTRELAGLVKTNPDGWRDEWRKWGVPEKLIQRVEKCGIDDEKLASEQHIKYQQLRKLGFYSGYFQFSLYDVLQGRLEAACDGEKPYGGKEDGYNSGAFARDTGMHGCPTTFLKNLKDTLAMESEEEMLYAFCSAEGDEQQYTFLSLVEPNSTEGLQPYRNMYQLEKRRKEFDSTTFGGAYEGAVRTLYILSMMQGKGTWHRSEGIWQNVLSEMFGMSLPVPVSQGEIKSVQEEIDSSGYREKYIRSYCDELAGARKALALIAQDPTPWRYDSAGNVCIGNIKWKDQYSPIARLHQVQEVYREAGLTGNRLPIDMLLSSVSDDWESCDGFYIQDGNYPIVYQGATIIKGERENCTLPALSPECCIALRLLGPYAVHTPAQYGRGQNPLRPDANTTKQAKQKTARDVLAFIQQFPQYMHYEEVQRRVEYALAQSELQNIPGIIDDIVEKVENPAGKSFLYSIMQERKSQALDFFTEQLQTETNLNLRKLYATHALTYIQAHADEFGIEICDWPCAIQAYREILHNSSPCGCPAKQEDLLWKMRWVYFPQLDSRKLSEVLQGSVDSAQTNLTWEPTPGGYVSNRWDFFAIAAGECTSNKTGLYKIPAVIARHPDYQAVFGNERPVVQVTEVTNYDQMKCTWNEYTFTVCKDTLVIEKTIAGKLYQWHPLRMEGKYAEMEILEKQGVWISKDNPLKGKILLPSFPVLEVDFSWKGEDRKVKKITTPQGAALVHRDAPMIMGAFLGPKALVFQSSSKEIAEIWAPDYKQKLVRNKKNFYLDSRQISTKQEVWGWVFHKLTVSFPSYGTITEEEGREKLQLFCAQYRGDRPPLTMEIEPGRNPGDPPKLQGTFAGFLFLSWQAAQEGLWEKAAEMLELAMQSPAQGGERDDVHILQKLVEEFHPPSYAGKMWKLKCYLTLIRGRQQKLQEPLITAGKHDPYMQDVLTLGSEMLSDRVTDGDVEKHKRRIVGELSLTTEETELLIVLDKEIASRYAAEPAAALPLYGAHHASPSWDKIVVKEDISSIKEWLGGSQEPMKVEKMPSEVKVQDLSWWRLHFCSLVMALSANGEEENLPNPVREKILKTNFSYLPLHERERGEQLKKLLLRIQPNTQQQWKDAFNATATASAASSTHQSRSSDMGFVGQLPITPLGILENQLDRRKAADRQANADQEAKWNAVSAILRDWSRGDGNGEQGPLGIQSPSADGSQAGSNTTIEEVVENKEQSPSADGSQAASNKTIKEVLESKNWMGHVQESIDYWKHKCPELSTDGPSGAKFVFPTGLSRFPLEDYFKQQEVNTSKLNGFIGSIENEAEKEALRGTSLPPAFVLKEGQEVAFKTACQTQIAALTQQITEAIQAPAWPEVAGRDLSPLEKFDRYVDFYVAKQTEQDTKVTEILVKLVLLQAYKSGSYEAIDEAQSEKRFTGKDSITARAILVAEYRSGNVSRVSQPPLVEALSRPINPGEKGVVVLSPPGAGKTTAIIPQAAQLIVQKYGETPVFVVTEELFSQGASVFDANTQKLYKQAGYVFSFTRNSSKEPIILAQEVESLYRTRAQGGYILTSPSRLAALRNEIVLLQKQLSFSARGVEESKDGGGTVSYTEEYGKRQDQLALLQAMYAFFYKEGKTRFVLDEVDALIRANMEYNYAVGDREPIPTETDKACYEIMEALANSNDSNVQALSKAIREGKQGLLDQETMQGAIGALREELNQNKAALSVLEKTFGDMATLIPESQIGPSSKGVIVVPKEHNMEIPGTRHSNPAALALAQYLYYLGKTPSEKFLHAFWEKNEMRFRCLWRLDDNQEFLQKSAEDRYVSLTEMMVQDYSKRLAVIHCMIEQEIHLYPEQICTDAYEIFPPGQKLCGLSGTMQTAALSPLFAGNHPTMQDRSALQKIVLQQDLSKEVPQVPELEFLLEKAKDRTVRAIVDQAGLQGHCSSYEVARQLHEKAPDRPILFVHPNDRQQYIWPPGAENPRIARSKDSEKANCLCYFAEADYRGTDWKLPDGKFVLVMGPKCTLNDLIQAYGRARKAGNGQTTVELFAQAGVLREGTTIQDMLLAKIEEQQQENTHIANVAQKKAEDAGARLDIFNELSAENVSDLVKPRPQDGSADELAHVMEQEQVQQQQQQQQQGVQCESMTCSSLQPWQCNPIALADGWKNSLLGKLSDERQSALAVQGFWRQHTWAYKAGRHSWLACATQGTQGKNHFIWQVGWNGLILVDGALDRGYCGIDCSFRVLEDGQCLCSDQRSKIAAKHRVLAKIWSGVWECDQEELQALEEMILHSTNLGKNSQSQKTEIVVDIMQKAYESRKGVNAGDYFYNAEFRDSPLGQWCREFGVGAVNERK